MQLAEGASVPSLGLSNKAVFEDDLNRANSQQESNLERHPKDKFPEFYYTPLRLTGKVLFGMFIFDYLLSNQIEF